MATERGDVCWLAGVERSCRARLLERAAPGSAPGECTRFRGDDVGEEEARVPGGAPPSLCRDDASTVDGMTTPGPKSMSGKDGPAVPDRREPRDDWEFWVMGGG